jgi:hypothetical protein
MKKISLFVLAVGSSLAMFAQGNDVTPMAVKPRFGIKAGVNLAEFNTKGFPSGEDPTTNMKTSMHGGFFVNIPLGTGGLAVQPELLYSGQGSKLTVKSTVGSSIITSTYEQDLSYINLPVMFQYKTPGGFYVETGPQAGIVVRAQQDGPGDMSTDNKDDFDKFDFAWAGGIGYVSRIGLAIGARYNWGLRNILDDTDSNSDMKMKNSVVNIGLAWHFGAGK